MFALVIDGVVSGVSKRQREVSTGMWLPVVEDDATLSPYGNQTVSGFTVEENRVIRHWRTIPDRVAPLESGQQSLLNAVELLTLAALEA